MREVLSELSLGMRLSAGILGGFRACGLCNRFWAVCGGGGGDSASLVTAEGLRFYFEVHA